MPKKLIIHTWNDEQWYFDPKDPIGTNSVNEPVDAAYLEIDRASADIQLIDGKYRIRIKNPKSQLIQILNRVMYAGLDEF